MNCRSRLLLLAGLALTGSLVAAVRADDEPEGWSAELAMMVKRIGSVEVSPDGARVAFEVGEAIMEGDTSEWRSHIHLAAADGSHSFQLTQGEKSCGNPRWSPDGQWIAFTSSRGADKTNLFIIRPDGGEAERITDLQGGLGAFRWSPDGSTIAFTMTDPATDEDKTNDKQKNDARVVDEDYKFAHLYLVPVQADADGARPVERLTEGDFNVGGGFGGAPFDWAPDGSTIAFSHTPTPRVDDWPLADISVVNVTTKEMRPFASTGAAEVGPMYSPDGSLIAFSVSDDPPTWAFTSRIEVVDATGGAPRALASTFDEQPGIIGFSADGTSIFVDEVYHTRGTIYALPLDGGPPTEIADDAHHVQGPSLNVSRTHFGFTCQAPDEPSEAFVSRAEAFDAVQVSHVQNLPDLPVPETRVINWSSTDGTAVEGLLTYPIGYQEGQRVPLLTIVHGGPTGVFQLNFIASRGAYPIAAFAQRGYAVLRCNPRGSSGYGKDFRYANYDDWGGGDFQDIMTGIDHVIGMGVADRDRLGVMGWSYGGYMTSWIITHTDRFAAASVGAGVTNLMSFTGTADIPSFIPDYFHTEFWDDLDPYREHSAMFNVKGVTTPTLIQHGERDARVPTTQGYELYNALKRQNVPVKMVVYPRQPHGIREPRLQLDAMKRNLEWFDQWIGPGPVETATP